MKLSDQIHALLQLFRLSCATRNIQSWFRSWGWTCWCTSTVGTILQNQIHWCRYCRLFYTVSSVSKIHQLTNNQMITFFIKLATLVLLRMRSPKPLKSNPPTENWYHSRHSCDVVLPVDLPVTNLLIPVRLVVSSKRLCAVIIGNWSESDGGTHTVLQTHIQ